jgi:hypothetical protein
MTGIANSAATMKAKIATRRAAIKHVGPEVAGVHVFDAFCGKGEMREQVWNEADTYVGCDKRYTPFESVRRFVGDNRVVLRSVDLQPYNIFDLDAFGSPWGCALIIAARRKWKPKERGAVIVTDGSGGKLRFGGGTFTAVRELSGVERILATPHAIDLLHTQLCQSFCKLANVRLARLVSSRSQLGQVIYFTAILFEGT